MKKATVKAALDQIGEIDDLKSVWYEAYAAGCCLEVVLGLFEGYPEIEQKLTEAMVICNAVDEHVKSRRLLYNLRSTYAWMDQWRSLTRRRPGRELGSNPNLGTKRCCNTHK